MKLTRQQDEILYNQHTGAGYLILKTGEYSHTVVDVSIGRNGKWCAGNGVPLMAYLEEAAATINQNQEEEENQ